MIIHLNGWPGVGKLTVGRALARQLRGRLVDNHTLHNVAFATCDFGSEERWAVYYAVRDIAYARIRNMPAEETIVMTNAFVSGVKRDEEGWAAINRLVIDRGDTLVAVTLTCSREENMARLRSDERLNNRKLVDTAALEEWLNNPDYRLHSGDGADHSILVETTDLTYDEAADKICALIKGCS